jgi:carboxyl-terminal processing protease
MKYRFAVILALIVLLSSLASGLLSGSSAGKSAPSSSTPPPVFLSNFTEALEVIDQNYVDTVGPDKLIYSSIKGMLRVLDPHSSFFTPKEFSRIGEDQHAKYYGLGIRVRPLIPNRGRHVIVEPPLIGTPAQKKGLRAGDVITRIEGEPIDDWTSDDVVNKLKGPRGSPVNITIERPGVNDPIQIKIERDEISMITVPYAFIVKPGFGYVKIERFSETTTKELRAKLKSLDVNNLSGLIIDLRDNPGGLLNQAIDVSGFFLPREDVVVTTKGRASGSAKSYPARIPTEDKVTIPLVVLINRHSASASEIVAGALQDHDRALIVGESSFGKGLVQSVYSLQNGTGMALTTAKYYTPSGRLIQRPYSSGSTFEYYYANGKDEPPQDTGEREVRYTDSHRKVYGGGGITPDIVEPAREPNRFEMLLASRDVFFHYARRLMSGEVPSAANFQLLSRSSEQDNDPEEKAPTSIPPLEITDAILEDFKEFLKGRRIDFTNEDIQTNVGYIKRRIKQDVFNSAFGLQEGFKIGIQGDIQALKALEVMPEAKSLMKSGHLSPAAQNQTR